MNTLLLITLLLQLSSAQPKTGIVTGTLLTANGDPAANIRVTAILLPEPGQPSGPVIIASIAATDPAGRYRLENILPGRYHITAGFVDLPTYYPGVASTLAAIPIPVVAGITSSGIDFRLAVSVGVKVTGRVIPSPNPNPPPNSRAALSGSRITLETTVSPDGAFEFPRVRPGAYSLRFNFAPAAALSQIVVGDNDVVGLEVSVVVPPVEITIVRDVPVRVLVDGGGPLPRIGFNKTDTGPVLTLAPQPDGTLHVPLLGGDHPVVMNTAASGYALKSLTYGAFDLIGNPLKISGADSDELRIILGPDKPNAWVKVRGQVTGLGAGAKLSLYMTPTGLPGVTATAGGGFFNTVTAHTISISVGAPGRIDVDVHPDGSFEIPAVLQGSYRMSIGVRYPAASPNASEGRLDTSATVVVGNEDLTALDIPIAPQRQVAGRMVVENSNPQPGFRLALAGGPGSAPITVVPSIQNDGAFVANLPEGEYRVSVIGLPTGYSVKSFTHANVNLLSDRMKVGSTNAELQVALAAQVNTIRFSGRVIGPASGPAPAPNSRRISIIGETQQDQLLAANGSFDFPKAIADNYSVRISLGSFSGDISIAARSAGSLTGLTFVAARGRVEMEGGARPPQEYFIEARNNSRDLPAITSTSLGETPQFRVRPDGTFSIVLMGGEQEIRVADLPANYEVRSIRYGSMDAMNKVLKIGPDDPPSDVHIVIGLRNPR